MKSVLSWLSYLVNRLISGKGTTDRNLKNRSVEETGGDGMEGAVTKGRTKETEVAGMRG